MRPPNIFFMILVGVFAIFVALITIAPNAGAMTGGTDFTLTGYDNVAPLGTSLYPGSTGVWRYAITNNSAENRTYFVEYTGLFYQGVYFSVTSALPGNVLWPAVTFVHADNTPCYYLYPPTIWYVTSLYVAPSSSETFYLHVTIPDSEVMGWYELAFKIYDNNYPAENSSKWFYVNYFVWPEAPQATNLYAVADTYTNSVATTTNYGASTTDNIKIAVGTKKDFTWLKFPLTLPANWVIQHVYLKYYVDSSSGSATDYFIQTLENVTWVESVITYADSGGATPTIWATSSTPFSQTVGWNTVNITDVIRPRVDAGDSFATVFLYYSGGGLTAAMNIRSKEYGDGSYAPYIQLEYLPLGAIHSPTISISSIVCPSDGSTAIVTENTTTWGSENVMNVYFQYVRADNWVSGWSSVPYTQVYAGQENDSTHSISTTLSGLVEDTYYYVRARAWCIRNQLTIYTPDFMWYQHASTITSSGGIAYLTPPSISTGDATNIDNSSAMLNGYIYSGEELFYLCWFDMSLYPNFSILISSPFQAGMSMAIPYSVFGPITITKTVSALATSLTADTTYYFRFMVISTAGLTIGQSNSFTTPLSGAADVGLDIIGLFAVFTGGDRAMAGYMVGAFFFLIPLTIVGLAVVAAAKAREHSALVILIFYLTGLFLVTVMSLFPWWFLTFHILIIALYFAHGYMSKGG